MKQFNFLKKLKENKKIQYILLAILLGVAVLILLFGTSFSNKKQEDITDEVNAYILTLESKLSQTLSKINGVGAVSVVITVESGMETVIATKTVTKETETGIETEETPILVNGKTVVLKENYPKIAGVLIVAEGAKNISVYSRIQNATTSLLDIDINQVEIMSMK